ncbi:MAG: STAS domain-containing protein [Fibrobacterota bacterium]
MQLNVRKRGQYKILDIDGDINEVNNYNVLKEEIVRSVNQDEKHIALNLGHTTFLNSGAVSLFISWQKKVAAAGGDIIILEPPQFILEILKILCIEKIIKIHNSEDEFFKKVGEN